MKKTPMQRWGTCCPYDPECEHSYLDMDDLLAWMHKPIDDLLALEIQRDVEPHPLPDKFTS